MYSSVHAVFMDLYLTASIRFIRCSLQNIIVHFAGAGIGLQSKLDIKFVPTLRLKRIFRGNRKWVKFWSLGYTTEHVQSKNKP